MEICIECGHALEDHSHNGCLIGDATGFCDCELDHYGEEPDHD